MGPTWPAPARRLPDPASVAGPPSASLSFADVELGDRIGEGGVAEVYEATAAIDGTRHRIALKRPAEGEDPSPGAIEDLTAEAETWAGLDDHEGVVGIVDWDTRPFFWVAMEYMDGGYLRGRIHREGALPVAEALWVGESVAAAVRHAHRHGVVHLDLKPENVLLRETPGETWNVPKVADWGLATHLLDSTAVKRLTPRYAAPEQFDGERYGELDDFTDVYQLGVVLYELLTGRQPYEGSREAVRRAVLDPGRAPRPPSDHRAELSPAVDAAVLTALETRKDDRYRAIHYFEDAVRALRGEGHLPPVVSRRLDGARRATGPAGHVDELLGRTRGPVGTDEARGPGTTAWPTFHGDSERTGHVPGARVPAGPVTTEWTALLGDPVTSSPAVAHLPDDGGSGAAAGATVFVGGYGTELHALDAATGDRAWAAETGSVVSQPAVAGGPGGATVVAGSSDGRVYALDAATGDREWVAATGDAVTAPPAVVDGTVYVGSTDATVYALDAATGDREWTVETGTSVLSPPAVAEVPGPGSAGGDTVFVANPDDHVYALDAATGDREWTVETGPSVLSSPAVAEVPGGDGPDAADGVTVFVGNQNGSVYALDAATGSQRWAFEPGDHERPWQQFFSSSPRGEASPAVAGDAVYVGSTDGTVYALDAATGDLRWSTGTGDSVFSSPAVAGIPGGDAIDDPNAPATPDARDDPGVGGATVLVGSDDGTLYALDAATGDTRWTVETDGRVASPAVADLPGDGEGERTTVLVGSDDRLFALGDPDDEGDPSPPRPDRRSP